MKILIIRFSSIGDIVLTTPVVRCLSRQIKNAEIHFLTKDKFKSVLNGNPYINRIITIKEKADEVNQTLLKEKYDVIIDLHHNFRSAKVSRMLQTKRYNFPKLNVKKWIYVQLGINLLPPLHIVDRYFMAVKHLSVENDLQGLDFFIGRQAMENARNQIVSFCNGSFIAWVLGAQHGTKKLPSAKIIELIHQSRHKFVLLGGNSEIEEGEKIALNFPGKVLSLCGKLSLEESAAAIQISDKVMTNDTGLMHIAAALKKEIHSFWGSTVPEFGMYPYLPGKETLNFIYENRDLSCRPCSKIGFKKCPEGHFKCMNDLTINTNI